MTTPVERRRVGVALAVSIPEAAGALSISRDSFERHVMPHLRLVRVGRRLLVPMRELDRWIEREMAIPLLAELSARRTSKAFSETNGAG
jgi:hypothetical protein